MSSSKDEVGLKPTLWEKDHNPVGVIATNWTQSALELKDPLY
jgi:hypothetical protein